MLSCRSDRPDIGALFGGSRVFNWFSNSLTSKSVKTPPIVEHFAKLPTDILLLLVMSLWGFKLIPSKQTQMKLTQTNYQSLAEYFYHQGILAGCKYDNLSLK